MHTSAHTQSHTPTQTHTKLYTQAQMKGNSISVTFSGWAFWTKERPAQCVYVCVCACVCVCAPLPKKTFSAEYFLMNAAVSWTENSTLEKLRQSHEEVLVPFYNKILTYVQKSLQLQI